MLDFFADFFCCFLICVSCVCVLFVCRVVSSIVCVVFFLVSHDLQHVIHGSPSTSLYGGGHAAKHGVRVLLRPFRL